MNILKRIKSLTLSGNSAPASLNRALKKFLTAKQIQEAILASPDRRRLIETIARLNGFSEKQLTLEVSRILRLSFIHNVSPIDLMELPPGILLSDFRAAGSIPFYEEDSIKGLVCVDPEIALPLSRKLNNAPLIMSRWIDIASALDISERLYTSKQQVALEEQSRKLNSLAVDVLHAVIKEATSYKAEVLEIIDEETQILYRFSTSENKKATGTIKPLVRKELFALLQGLSKSSENHSGLLETIESITINLEEKGEHAFITLAADGKNVEEENKKVAAPASPQTLQPEEDVKVEPLRLAPSVAAPKRPELVKIAEDSLSQLEEKKEDEESLGLVLVVDDNPTFAKVLERFFSRQNIVTTSAQDGLQALEMLESGACTPDLIVSDVHMPSMNGFEFLKKARQIEFLKNTPIVMLTSDDDVETELKLLSDGADAFVTKNEDPRILCVQVKRLLQKLNRKAA